MLISLRRHDVQVEVQLHYQSIEAPPASDTFDESATLPKPNASGLRLDADAVVDSRRNSLGASEVTLGGLHQDVPEEKLNLLQVATSGTTKASTTPSEIVRRELGHANLRCEFLDAVPDELFPHSFTPYLASATHATEEASTVDSGSVHPVDQETTHPIGDGHRPNVASLSAQIYDRPMAFTLLEVINREISEFVPPKDTRQKGGEQSPISLALHSFSIGSAAPDPLQPQSASSVQWSKCSRSAKFSRRCM
jgi:hypothetical protein